MKRNNASNQVCNTRIIAHIDMDCFYVQVERKINTNLIGKPVAVVQYNPFGDLKSIAAHENRILEGKNNGSLIAVSYEARAKGVKRNMRGSEARAACPEILLVQVPTGFQKADLMIYREAGESVVAYLRQFGNVVEKASVDEVYIDLTESVKEKYRHLIENSSGSSSEETQKIVLAAESCRIAGDDKKELSMSRRALSHGHAGTGSTSDSTSGSAALDVLGKSLPFASWTLDDKYLAIGAHFVQEMRAGVLATLKFTCSGGIGHNKMLAKIASGMHKPNQQTIVPSCIVSELMSNMPISRVPGFGGKLGNELLSLGIGTFGDIQSKPEVHQILKFNFDWELAERIIGISEGIETEPVKDRFLVKNIGCSKMFHQNAQWLDSKSVNDGRLEYWIRALGSELHSRVLIDMAANDRKPKNLAIGISVANMPVVTQQTADPAIVEDDKATGFMDDIFDENLDNEIEEESNTNLGIPDVFKLAATADQVGSRIASQSVANGGAHSTTILSAPSIHSTTSAQLRYTSSEHMSRAGPMKLTIDGIVDSCLAMVKYLVTDNVKLREPWRIRSMGLVASQFETIVNDEKSIRRFFNAGVSSSSSCNLSEDGRGMESDAIKSAEYTPAILPHKEAVPSTRGTISAWVKSPTRGVVSKGTSFSRSHTVKDNDNEFIDATRVIAIEDDNDVDADKDAVDPSSNISPAATSLEEDIDMEVFQSLPLDIQRELKFSLRGSKKLNEIIAKEKRKSSSTQSQSNKMARIDKQTTGTLSRNTGTLSGFFASQKPK